MHAERPHGGLDIDLIFIESFALGDGLEVFDTLTHKSSDILNFTKYSRIRVLPYILHDLFIDFAHSIDIVFVLFQDLLFLSDPYIFLFIPFTEISDQLFSSSL